MRAREASARGGGLGFHNYPGGTGLTAGAVYECRAGYAAAGGERSG